MLFAELSQAAEQNVKINPNRSSKASKRSSRFFSNNPYKMEHRRHASKDSRTDSVMSRKHPLRGSRDGSGLQVVDFEYEPYYAPSMVEIPETPNTPSYPAAFSHIARFLNQSGFLSTPFQSNEFLPNPPPKDRKSTDIMKWLGGNRRSRVSLSISDDTPTPPSPSELSSPDGPFYSTTDLPFASATDLSSALDPIPNQHHYQNLRFRGASLFRLDESLSEQDMNEVRRQEPVVELATQPEQTHVRHHSEPIARKPVMVYPQHARNNSEPLRSLVALPGHEPRAADPRRRAGQFSEDLPSQSDIQYKPTVLFLPNPTLIDDKVRERKRLSKESKESKEAKKPKESKESEEPREPKVSRETKPKQQKSIENLKISPKEAKRISLQAKKEAAEARLDAIDAKKNAKKFKKAAAKEEKRIAKAMKKENAEAAKRRSKALDAESVIENRKSLGQHSIGSKDARNKLLKAESVKSRKSTMRERGTFQEQSVLMDDSTTLRDSGPSEVAPTEKVVFKETGFLTEKRAKARESKAETVEKPKKAEKDEKVKYTERGVLSDRSVQGTTDTPKTAKSVQSTDEPTKKKRATCSCM